MILSSISLVFMMVHKLLLWTESNALSKSTKCTYKDDLHSHTCSRMFLTIKICSVVPLPCLNPACFFLSISSSAFLILLTMALPRILLVTIRSVTPFQLLHSLKFPILGNLTINPFFHLSGILSSYYTWRNNLVSSFTDASLLALIIRCYLVHSRHFLIRNLLNRFFHFLLSDLTNFKLHITINNSLILV